MPGVEAVEVWSRTLDYQHGPESGPELVRVYELRPYTPSRRCESTCIRFWVE
jgi:hypothetical protein